MDQKMKRKETYDKNEERYSRFIYSIFLISSCFHAISASKLGFSAALIFIFSIFYKCDTKKREKNH